ncbi:MAG: DUF4340 domain-containing protein [Saprospiraceae bacterium]|nr:DUF4340 domain-containing protein [Saprospiraceae bacterium]
MNQTKILLIVFAIFGSVAAWFLLKKGDDKTTVLTWERDFKIENTDEIYKIFVADRKGNTATLERDGAHWNLDGKYRASQNVVDNMLDVFRNVEILFIPPAAAVETMVTDLATNGIKVEAFDKSGEKIKGYYVGGSTPDERGTFLIREGAETPFITSMPNFSGTYWIRFVPQGDKWRDRTVFAYKPEEIAKVTMEYPKQRNKSFIVERGENGFDVLPYYDLSAPISGTVSQGAVEGFLTQFESLAAENYINGSPSLQNVQGKIPFASISVETISGDLKQIQIWPMDNIDNSGRIKSPETERYYCLDNNGDFLLIQQRVFGDILWAYESFFR